MLTRLGSACRAARVRAERLLVGEDVVGDDQRARLDLLPRQHEQPLVVVLLGVEEDDVEDVLHLREHLERVALDELGPLLEPRVGDVPPPGLAFAGSCSIETTRPEK